MSHESALSLYQLRDTEGRRCDGNNRRCTHRATEQHLVRRHTDGTMGDPELKQTCSRHPQQFVNSQNWQHISTSRMGGRAWPQGKLRSSTID